MTTQQIGADWPNGFMLIQGNRLEDLRELLVDWLRRHPLAPLENETILVQSNGIAQWLRLALAADPQPGGGGCGVAAALDVTLPARFLWRAYCAVLGTLPPASPFDCGQLAWHLYALLADPAAGAPDAVLDTGSDSRWAPLRGYLEAGEDEPLRRYRLATRLADLFDQYQTYRADWLAAWLAGKDTLIDAHGMPRSLPAGQCWQAELWRVLNRRIVGNSRADIHSEFIERVEKLDRAPPDLPRRIVVFGISALPRQWLEAFAALARHAQVLVFAQNPCRHDWSGIVEGRELFRKAYRRHPERLDLVASDDDLHVHGHPLLAAWGKQGRDYLRLLDEYDERGRYVRHFRDQAVDLFRANAETGGTPGLLGQLQDDILDLCPLTERVALAATVDPVSDRSIEFLIAHSRQREIEILHDRLLDAFAQSAATSAPLQPREVLVMVPDIDAYAPHIEAVFGRLSGDDPRRLPFHIADQSTRRRVPLLIGFERLLQLPEARWTLGELLDLLDIPALRARFAIAEDALPQLRQWLTGANVRWGLDATQRAAQGLPDGQGHNSLRFGLERLLLGFASGAAGPWCGIAPYDEVAGLAGDLLGRLVRVAETLERHRVGLLEPRPPAQWGECLAQLIADCFAPEQSEESDAIEQLDGALAGWLEDAGAGTRADLPLPRAVVVESLLARLDRPRLSQRFLGGAINFATLMPMRAVPFRQIWLLGMNDGEYPRIRRALDFDLMAGDYRPGDRSRREDDRYLFLEALLAAREKLVIGWIGRGVRDDAERPASVLVAQLREHLAAGWRSADSETPLLEALTSSHPLQPFSRRYFSVGENPWIFTYAGEWRPIDGVPPAVVSAPRSPWLPEGPLGLRDLADFLKSPVDAFFRQRLRIAPPDEAEILAETETFDSDGLARWNWRQMLLDAFEPGLDDTGLKDWLGTCIDDLQRRGELIDGAYGELMGAEIVEPLTALYARWSEMLCTWPEPDEQACDWRVEVTAGGGHLVLEGLAGSLRRNSGGGYARIILQASNLVDQQNHYRLRPFIRPWLDHLAAQLAGVPVTTVLLTPKGEAILPPVLSWIARRRLTWLLRCWWQGMQSPLPVTLEVAANWLGKGGDRRVAASAAVAASDLWRAAQKGFEHDHSAYLRRVYPDFARLWHAGGFAVWTERLYRAPFRALHRKPETGT